MENQVQSPTVAKNTQVPAEILNKAVKVFVKKDENTETPNPDTQQLEPASEGISN